MSEFPTKGRLWLPADAEGTEALLTRLQQHHCGCAGAVWRGPEHVAKHAKQAATAADTLAWVLAEQTALASKTAVPQGGNFIIAGSAQSSSTPALAFPFVACAIAALLFVFVFWAAAMRENPSAVSVPLASPRKIVPAKLFDPDAYLAELRASEKVRKTAQP